MKFISDLDALKLAVEILNACTDDEFDDEGWEAIQALTDYCDQRLDRQSAREDVPID